MNSVLKSTSLSTEVIQKSIEGENGITMYFKCPAVTKEWYVQEIMKQTQ